MQRAGVKGDGIKRRSRGGAWGEEISSARIFLVRYYLLSNSFALLPTNQTRRQKQASFNWVVTIIIKIVL